MILDNSNEQLLKNLVIIHIRRMFLYNSRSNTDIQLNMIICIKAGRSNTMATKSQLDRQNATNSSRSQRRIYFNLDMSSLIPNLTCLSNRNFSITGWTPTLQRQNTNSLVLNLTKITRYMWITTWASELTWSTKKCIKWIQTRQSHNLRAIQMSKKKWLPRF